MQRGFAIGVMILLLAPGAAFATNKAPREPRFDVRKIVKQLIGRIMPLDEILTGPRP